jgi:hypothetical protein
MRRRIIQNGEVICKRTDIVSLKRLNLFVVKLEYKQGDVINEFDLFISDDVLNDLKNLLNIYE